MTTFLFSAAALALVAAPAATAPDVGYEDFAFDPTAAYSDPYRACSGEDALKGDLSEMVCFFTEVLRAEAALKAAPGGDRQMGWQNERDALCNRRAAALRPNSTLVQRAYSRCQVDETLRRAAWLRRAR